MMARRAALWAAVVGVHVALAAAAQSGDAEWNVLWGAKTPSDPSSGATNASSTWGTCVPPSQAAIPAVRVCLVGLPASAVWSAAFSHQVYGHLRTTYSLLRSHGLGPYLDACAVSLLINAPRDKRWCRRDASPSPTVPREWHPDLSWPSCNSFLRRAFERYIPWWRPLLRNRPTFYRADDRLGRRDRDDVAGWCHHQAEGAVILSLPAIAVAPSARWTPEAQEAAEANATAFVDSVVARSRTAAHPPTFIVRVPRGVKAKAAKPVAQPLRNVFSRHNLFLHRAARRRFGATDRWGEGTLRLTLVARRGGADDLPLPVGPSAQCVPRGLRNLDAVAGALRSLCAERLPSSDAGGGGGGVAPPLCAFRGPARLRSGDDAQRGAQVRLAATTDVLVLYHGAALASAMWMPPDALVVVVFPRGYISTWYGVAETEDARRNLTWVLATQRGGLTFGKFERGGKALAKWMPGLQLQKARSQAQWRATGPVPQAGWPEYHFHPRKKDTCRAWDPTPVLGALRSAMRACHPQRAADGADANPDERRRHCMRGALARWQAAHPQEGAWVLAHKDRPAHAFLEISDDGG